MGESRFAKDIGGPQRWQVRVSVDDPNSFAQLPSNVQDLRIGLGRYASRNTEDVPSRVID